MKTNDVVELLKQKFHSFKEPYVKAILLFGSSARGEAKDRSDIDLLLLHEGCEIKDIVLRRRYFYNLLREVIGNEFDDLTVIDMEIKYFIKPKEITSLLLNIYWDAIVIYDLTNSLEDFLKNVRDRIIKSGLKRVKDGNAYYWTLPEPIKEVKIL